ncbi:geranylgeranyl transferase type II alpha subunit [Aspergillus heteromorphus CBS 117.55]|uniref:Geranylgeranyl transferase type-2 subunit alpha n=1 Tax=Aspergillus heteromorphus CBS 117.55 TaxID=1448321 RepID=A0A317WTW2_9EURO|nr:geranylgeranyl transferase type II alpha subunit [Aspergillus heteromorphus CBS 117.55]PWY87670.1 geranylgeranyl transferase type II alpha subunit [Aspergillus heteromorphus CBS 117.55]
MAAHGIPRYTRLGEKTEEVRQQELHKIEKYRELDQSVRDKVAAQQYTPETLQKITELLTSNPEYYTVWNYRRQVLRSEFSRAASAGSEEATGGQIATLIKDDLMFLIPLLRSFPKCYWIWNYRTWLLDEAKRLLPVPTARKFWQEELALVGKMLSLDSRNFHGWGYRLFVVETLRELRSEELEEKDMTRTEFEYAKKMIGANLSNFSAWHYRTKLIQRLLRENSASDEERRKMLDDELDLIHRALCDPYDQSLWFYHQNLMCTFDPSVAGQTLAPNLSDSERLDYLRREIEEIQEMLDGAEDCKYIYQALIDCTMLSWKVEGREPSGEPKTQVLGWLSELKKLDPLRHQRWLDFEQSLCR